MAFGLFIRLGVQVPGLLRFKIWCLSLLCLMSTAPFVLMTECFWPQFAGGRNKRQKVMRTLLVIPDLENRPSGARGCVYHVFEAGDGSFVGATRVRLTSPEHTCS